MSHVWVESERGKGAVNAIGDEALIACRGLTPATWWHSVQLRVLSTFLSFAFAGTLPVHLVEFRMDTRTNSSESLAKGFCDLREDQWGREGRTKINIAVKSI